MPENLGNSCVGDKFVGELLKMSDMSKFYIVMLVLLVIATINFARALNEKKQKSKVIGVTINAIAIALIVTAIILSL